jgi:predicted kinase
VGGGAYDAASSERTYECLAEVARTALAHGFDTIVDATFLKRTERAAFGRLAADVGARFAILDCFAPEAELRRRIAVRTAQNRDASEATTAVLDRQLETAEPLTAAELSATVRADTTADLDASAIAGELAGL